VAESLDVSPQHISDILKGNREISRQLAEKMGYVRVVVFEPKV
jgi:plasmid maintenance system antidote protein VapI